jgi:nucleotide sugar dehydrogenase
MTVTVVGLGKIGLPLAVQFARKGETVLGADINQETVDLINRGMEPFPEEANLQEYLAEVVKDGKLIASTSTTKCVEKSDVVIVVVPLFVNENAEPDFKAMDSATEEIANGLQRGTLVAYETTLPVGTTRNRFTKALEKISGLTVGTDFYVVFSPERVLTGRVFTDLRKYPKIVGGVTKKCSEVGEEFYARVLEFNTRDDLSRKNGVWVLDSCESAEFVKLAETTYRDVNIGLANQFAKFADTMNLNVYNVIEAANSQPYAFIHQPGVAVGGHCIPIYPKFYLWNDPSATIVSSARECNEAMPAYLLSKVREHFGDLTGINVLILGASYRPNVKELAFSGVFSVFDSLKASGAKVEVYDPLYSSHELSKAGLKGLETELEKFETVIIQTANPDFINMLASRETFQNLDAIFDGRNLFCGVSPIDGVHIYGIGS